FGMDDARTGTEQEASEQDEAAHGRPLYRRPRGPKNERRVPSSGTRLHSRPSPPRLRGLFEIGQVAAEEVARALLHLPDALAREAPLLAQVLQRARIVLRQAVAQDVPRQLTHALAHLAEGVAHVLLALGPDDLLVRRWAVVAQTVEMGRLALRIERLL